MKDEELAAELRNWLRKYRNSVHKYESPVWKTIKHELEVTGNFKAAPRGRPDSSHFYKNKDNYEEKDWGL